MKKLLLSTLLIGSILAASELKNLLNDNYNHLFDLELQKSLSESNYNSLSWVSPIVLSFQRSWNTQVEGTTNPLNRYSISINQPIFKSGGIYYGIKFAKANYNLSKISIIKKRNELIAKAVELLYRIKKTKLVIAKLKLQVKNSDIEINSRQELYSAGVSSSIDLDTALAKKDEAQLALLDMQTNLQELKSAFAKISNKNPDRLKLPKLSLVDRDRFIANNLDIDLANAKANTKEYAYKATRSRYLPTVSVSASYTKVSKAQPFTKDKFANYSLQVSMPISVNMGNDLERAKLDSLISKVEAKTKMQDAKIDYKSVAKKLAIIDKRVAVANKEAKIYKRLANSTNRLYKAGQRSKNDVALLRNSYKMKKLDAQIYALDKQIELLKLYSKMR